MSDEMPEMLPGEQVIWEGRPEWRAVACDLFRVRWVTLYLALCLIFGLHNARAAGSSPVASVVASLPYFLLSLALLGGCGALAWGNARTTRYTITNQRCVLRFGLALSATLSVPLSRIAQVSVLRCGDTAGHIALALKPVRRLNYVKLWPHVRPWRFGRPQPMLRSIPHAVETATLLAAATAAVSPGRLADYDEQLPAHTAPLRPARNSGSP